MLIIIPIGGGEDRVKERHIHRRFVELSGGAGADIVVGEAQPLGNAPSFADGPDVNVLEDAGPQMIIGWATGITAGPANESGQGLTFNVLPEST